MVTLDEFGRPMEPQLPSAQRDSVKELLNDIDKAPAQSAKARDKIIDDEVKESVKMEKEKETELDVQILAWNIIAYFLSVLGIFLFIQHAIFFYGWPLNKSVWIDDPWWLYFFYGAIVYLLYKFYDFVFSMGKLFKEVAPVEQLDSEEE